MEWRQSQKEVDGLKRDRRKKFYVGWKPHKVRITLKVDGAVYTTRSNVRHIVALKMIISRNEGIQPLHELFFYCL